MNCAGYARPNSSSLRHGAPRRANGIEPESYQASMTSGTRCAGPPQSGQAITTVVHVRPVRVEVGQVAPGQLTQLGQ